MIAKFNLYDFIANLIPGLVFLWCIERMGAAVGWRPPFEVSGGLAETSILVAVGYVIGLMLQAIAERCVERKILLRMWGGFPTARWLLPEDDTLSTSYKDRVRTLIKERFKVSTDPELPPNCTLEEAIQRRLKLNFDLAFLCYDYVDNLSPRPLTFTAQYGLFRCLLTLFSLLALLSASLSIWAIFARPDKILPFVLLLLLYALFAWLSYERCKKRSENFARTIFNLFVGGTAAKPSD